MNSPDDLAAGLCASCHHARRLVSGRQSIFWLCGRAAEDPAKYMRYPTLPVRDCPGWEPKSPALP